MSLKINKNEIIYVIFMVFFLRVTYSIFQISNFNSTVIVIGFLGWIYIALHYVKCGIHKKELFYQGIWGFIIPMTVVTVISVFSAVYVHHTDKFSDVTQSIFRYFLYCSAYVIAYFSVKKFGKKTVKLIVVAGVISYSTVIVQWLAAAGINGILHPFNNKVNGISLEVHGLTYYFGMFLIYYVLSNQYIKREKIKNVIFLMLLIILGNKRALYVALLITAGIYYLFHKFESRRMRMLSFVIICYIGVALIYILSIKIGALQILSNYLGLNDNTRFVFWDYFNQYYQVKWNYLGRGIQFTDIRMATIDAMTSMRITIQTQMHNDILKTYIGWGFLPFIYYFTNYFLQVKRFVRAGLEQNAWKYFAIASYSFFLFFFTNIFDRAEYHCLYFVIWFLLMKEGKTHE